MSINKTHYFILGGKMGYDEFYAAAKIDDENETYFDGVNQGIERHNSITVITDSMDCEYVAFGFVIKKSLSHGELDDFVSPDIPSIDDVGDMIAKELGINIVPAYTAFTHIT